MYELSAHTVFSVHLFILLYVGRLVIKLVVTCVGGNSKLAQMVKGLEVFGAESGIGAMNRRVKHQDKFKVGSLDVTALSTPCHTSGHVCYYVENDQGA